ncbi:hypothetical protein PCCS19_18580 [Paenibacillus sp. CCS19]|uniref:hypothetical protein n=1 Tax=Paenibacillus sp. CCS19 TaxID=3158387 RepID=UPI00256B6BDF|nr:hypothetical protein [Paenibacillus cellulosilyticus]GMK38804.1 hypothetical protein PCCS19_18580 [Paenibacillus cellulosilyticus]
MATKWAFSHLTWQLARNSYEAWLNVAREHAAQAIRPITKYDAKLWPDHLLSIIKDENKIRLLYTNHAKESLRETLSCPYEDKRYRKISEDEVSFLPIRLAMKNGYENEKREAERYLARLKIVSIVQ